ncbi:MAG TPA: hypothetical protein VHA75_05525, partial [Rugosimonospora sp.]|nr:hypothetical protein [Rugosimonospora sp.]
SSGAADSAKAPAFAGPGSLVIRHTNSDYTIDTLPTGPNGVGQAGAQGNARDLEGLARLNDPAALDTCLAAVVAAHPGTVEIVEYARFEGSPALIVLVADAAGTRTVVAGPDCGLPGRGDDEVYVTPAR